MKLVQFIHSRSMYDYDEDLATAEPMINPTDERIADVQQSFQKYLGQGLISWYGMLTYEIDREKGTSELLFYIQETGKLKERIVLNKEAMQLKPKYIKTSPWQAAQLFQAADVAGNEVEEQPVWVVGGGAVAAQGGF